MTVELHVLEEDDRIVRTDRLDEQPLRVHRIGRDDHFQTRCLGHQAFEGVSVEFRRVYAAPEWCLWRAIWPAIPSIASNTKPKNWISTTGRNPSSVRPSPIEASPLSARGVSKTRASPNSFCRPSVARNTPPFTPTSSPKTRTFSSFLSSVAIASVIAWIIVICAIDYFDSFSL